MARYSQCDQDCIEQLRRVSATDTEGSEPVGIQKKVVLVGRVIPSVESVSTIKYSKARPAIFVSRYPVWPPRHIVRGTEGFCDYGNGVHGIQNENWRPVTIRDVAA